MDFKKMRVALLVGLLVAGCGTVGLPNGTISMTEADAQRMYALLDTDPTVSTITSMLAKLGVKVQLTTTTTTTETATEATVPSNAATVTGVDQAAPASTNECRVTHVAASSTLNDQWFALANCTDGNTHSAWAPAAGDAEPTLTFDLAASCTLKGFSLKLSPVGVVVDVEASADGQAWKPVATGIVPVYRQLHWVNLPATTCSHVRLRFRGVQDGHLLVCEAHPNGTDDGMTMPSTAPSASPTASPVPSTSPVASATPTATPTPEASATATPTPAPTTSADAGATPPAGQT
jgi:hypothetical protein